MAEFNPDEYLNEGKGFDPDEYLGGQAEQQQQVKKLPETSVDESLFRGAAQGLSLDFADEGTAKVVSKITGRPYEEVLQEVRDKYLAAEQSHPYAYGGAKVGGAVAPFLIPGAAVSKIPVAAKALGFLKGSKWIAPTATAAVQGYGASEETDPEKQLGDATIGGLMGLGTAGLFNAATGTPQSIRNFASNRAAAQLGAERGTIRKFGADRVRQAGRSALENDILSTNTEQMQQAAENLQKSSGKRMGEILGQVDEKLSKPVSPQQIGTDLIDEQRGLWDGEKFYDNLLNIVTLKGEKNISLDQAMQLKQFLGKQARFSSTTRSDAANVAGDAYWIVSKHIDDAIKRGEESLGTTNLLVDFQKAKKNYADTKVMETLLENRYAREQGNKMGTGLTNTIVGSEAAQIAAAGSPVKGAALMGGKLAWEKYGNIGMSKGADLIADILQYAPQKLGPYAQPLMNASRQGARSLAVTHYIMSQKDPQYYELVKQAAEDEKKKQIATPKYKGLGADLGSMIDNASFTGSTGLDPQEMSQEGFEYGEGVPQPSSIKPFSFKKLFPSKSAVGSEIKILNPVIKEGSIFTGDNSFLYRTYQRPTPFVGKGGERITTKKPTGENSLNLWDNPDKVAIKKAQLWRKERGLRPDLARFDVDDEGTVFLGDKNTPEFGISRGFDSVPHEHIHTQLFRLNEIDPKAEQAMDEYLQRKARDQYKVPIDWITNNMHGPKEFMPIVSDLLQDERTRKKYGLSTNTNNDVENRINQKFLQRLRKFYTDSATEVQNMSIEDVNGIISEYKKRNDSFFRR